MGWELALVLATLRLAVPLALAAMGELVAERSGVLNIGIEGMMLVGAFGAYAAGAASGSVPLALLAAAAAGVLLAALFALFVLERRADPIVCGTAINLLALGITGSADRLWSGPGAAAASVPRMGDWLSVNGFIWITAGLAGAIWIGLGRTRAGLSIRAAGERAEAAHAQGVRVLPIRWVCTLAGGAAAGLAGATLVLWISSSFVEGMTSGRGFIALALVLFGGYSVPRILGGALLFGLASALQFRLQALGLAIPYNLLLMLPYVLTLVVLAVFAGRARPPADLARPFETQ